MDTSPSSPLESSRKQSKRSKLSNPNSNSESRAASPNLVESTELFSLLNSIKNNQRQTIDKLDRLENSLQSLESRLSVIEEENSHRRNDALEEQQTRKMRSWFGKSWGERLDDAAEFFISTNFWWDIIQPWVMFVSFSNISAPMSQGDWIVRVPRSILLFLSWIWWTGKSFYRWSHPLIYNDHGPRIWTRSAAPLSEPLLSEKEKQTFLKKKEKEELINKKDDQVAGDSGMSSSRFISESDRLNESNNVFSNHPAFRGSSNTSVARREYEIVTD